MPCSEHEKPDKLKFESLEQREDDSGQASKNKKYENIIENSGSIEEAAEGCARTAQKAVDKEIRKLGIKIGTGLGLFFIWGGIAYLEIYGGEIPIAVFLLGLGAVCLGSAFALASGEKIKLRDFTGELFGGIFQIFRRSSKDDEAENDQT